MKFKNGIIRLSASDLSDHLACRHLTANEITVACNEKIAPDWANPDTWVLQQHGLQHEQNYLNYLQASGLSIVNLGEVGTDAQAIQETRAAMKDGAEVIAQASMQIGRWFGRADVLRRVDTPS